MFHGSLADVFSGADDAAGETVPWLQDITSRRRFEDVVALGAMDHDTFRPRSCGRGFTQNLPGTVDLGSIHAITGSPISNSCGLVVLERSAVSWPL
jgi:hypothetical protein